MKSLIMFFQKMNWIKAFLLGLTPILATITNMENTLIALGIIVFIDTLTGIRKSLYENGLGFNLFKYEFWQVLSSSGLRGAWRKAYEYTIGIIAFAVLDSLVLNGVEFTLLKKSFTIPELAATLACCIEIYSIYENMEAVSGRNLFKSSLSFLPKRMSEALGHETSRRRSPRRSQRGRNHDNVIDDLIQDASDEISDN